MYRVFLGGTCSGSKWRDILIPKLNLNYFNPVVNDWNKEARLNEEDEKRNKCNIHLYLITPEIQGFYSIAELANDSIRFLNVVFTYLEDFNGKKFNQLQLHSLHTVAELVNRNGAKIFKNIDDTANCLNNYSIIGESDAA